MDGVIKYKPKNFSRLGEIRSDAYKGTVARTLEKSVEAIMHSREVVARSKNLLLEIRESRLHKKRSTD